MYSFESEIPEKKSIYFSLTYIFGLGRSKAFYICKKLGFCINLKTIDLTTEQKQKVFNMIKSLNLKIGADLKKYEFLQKSNLLSKKSYKGLRLNRGLPV